MSDQPDILNIPAYLRKRSISAKARKPIINPKFKKTGKKKVQTIEEISLIAENDEFIPGEFMERKQAGLKGVREMQECGFCEGYIDALNVAILKLTAPLREGDRIIFEKTGGLFEQDVDSMQIDRKEVRLARTGSDVGLKVYEKPKVGAPIYKVI